MEFTIRVKKSDVILAGDMLYVVASWEEEQVAENEARFVLRQSILEVLENERFQSGQRIVVARVVESEGHQAYTKGSIYEFKDALLFRAEPLLRMPWAGEEGESIRASVLETALTSHAGN